VPLSDGLDTRPCKILDPRLLSVCPPQAGDEEQRWANHKSNHNAKSQIVLEKDKNLYAKSQIKSQITSSNHKSFSRNQIK